jgi:hypothetical protein
MIIDSWDKLTIGKWQEAITLDGIRLEGFEASIELLRVLSDLTIKDIHALTLIELNNYSAKLNFLNTPCESKLKDSFKVNGKTFNVNWRLESRTAGQFIDLTSLTKDPDLINQNLHYILSILCLPKGEDYNSESFEDRAQLFKEHLTMDVALPMSVFFYKVLTESLPNIADSLTEKANQMTKDLKMQMEKEHSANTGVGMQL